MELSKNQYLLVNVISDGFHSHAKLEKTVYLIQSIVGLFNYSFYRGNSGPSCYELNQDLEALIYRGYITYSYHSKGDECYRIYKVSQKSHKFLRRNLKILNIVFNKKTRKDLLHLIYESSIIRDLEIGDWFPLTTKNKLKNHFTTLELGGIEDLGKTTT